MKPECLKHPERDEWSFQLRASSLRVTRTMLADYTYTVSDLQRLRKAGNVGDFELAKAEALRSAQELGSA
jgi:hypothetical protein